MKKRIAAFGMMFAAVCGTTTVHAADGWYAGGSIGYANNKFSSSAPLVLDEEDKPVPMSEKKHATAYKLFGGYQFNQNWATEFEYIDFGKYKSSISGVSDAGVLNIKSSALAASLVGMWSFNDAFSAIGKLGLASKHTQTTGDLSDPNGMSLIGSRTTLVPLLGIGAEYRLTQRVSLRAEYEYLGTTEVVANTDKYKIKNSLLSVGLRYRF